MIPSRLLRKSFPKSLDCTYVKLHQCAHIPAYIGPKLICHYSNISNKFGLNHVTACVLDQNYVHVLILDLNYVPTNKMKSLISRPGPHDSQTHGTRGLTNSQTHKTQKSINPQNLQNTQQTHITHKLTNLHKKPTVLNQPTTSTNPHELLNSTILHILCKLALAENNISETIKSSNSVLRLFT